jgi:hypothetical protein
MTSHLIFMTYRTLPIGQTSYMKAILREQNHFLTLHQLTTQFSDNTIIRDQVVLPDSMLCSPCIPLEWIRWDTLLFWLLCYDALLTTMLPFCSPRLKLAKLLRRNSTILTFLINLYSLKACHRPYLPILSPNTVDKIITTTPKPIFN